MKKIVYLMLLSLLSLTACGDKNDEEVVVAKDPVFFYSIPEDKAENVAEGNQITLYYNTDITIANNAGIKVNRNVAEASVSGRKLTLNVKLEINKTYEVEISDNAIANSNGKLANSVSFSFSTVSNTKRYEAENATLLGDAVIEKTLNGFSGTGYVNQKDGNLSFKIVVPETGKYKLSFRYSNGNQKKENDIIVNGTKLTTLLFDPTNDWKIISLNKVLLNKGDNIIEIKKNWGWTYYDYIDLELQSPDTPFNISADLVTSNPSPEAVKVYTFLKDNFGKKVVSGAMANYNTGLEEATWMHEKTGKWPALAGFDFIDYTRQWDWIDYQALVKNGKNWWSNNGLIALTWHWRDPSRITDDFYTEKTSFDISKINDASSSEYKAMISDIDIIAGYLKQFKTANIPVLWRPLHEASGGWFWWGAKGPEPCKKLWTILYDRMVNYHGLNNLIWVWTTDSAANALDWYPGDSYVDILGMDIYPGENQHGSQFIAFDKVKELYQGKKIIALSECGSIPSIDQMFEFGDTWSWFMPWNGDYTRSDKHNGAAYITALFANDKVITRDKMPSLK